MPDQERISDVDASTIESITNDFEAEQDDLFRRMNVIGLGVSTRVRGGVDTGESTVKVLVSKKLSPDLLDRDALVPSRVGQYETDVV